MADTYRGLTIRIGGDSTSLQKALRSVNSSVSATEQQLRKMKRALEMDPGNVGAVETNLRLVGQRAVEAQQRLAQLKRSYQEIGSQKVELFKGTSAQTIRQLASATEDANARAAEAKRNYAEVVEQLARVKNEIKGLTGIDLDDELNPDETVETMRQLGMVTDDVADKYASLRSSYQKAFDENEVAKQVAAFSDLEVEIARTDAEAKSLAGRFSELSRASHGIDFGEGIDDQLRRIDAAAESVNDEMRRLDSALKLDDGDVGTIALKLRDMHEASTLAERKMELLQQKLSRMNATGIGNLSDETRDAALAAQKAADEYDEATAAVTKLKGELSELESRQSLLNAKDAAGTDEYRELGDQIRSARTQLDRLVETQREAKAAVDTSAQVTEYRQLQTELAETRAQADRLNDEMRRMGSFTGLTQGSLVSLGMSLSTTVTPAMAALGYGMVDAANTIDAAYRDMRKTVDGTEEDFENLRQAAIEFSATHVTSADQILSIQAIGGELGVATEDLKVFAETVSNLDVATNLGAEEAATALGQLDNILNDLDGSTMPNFADALVRLGNNGASTESQIADIASRIGAMGSIIGMTTPDILAWASTIASTGQGTEAAGTAISNTMRDIETAVAKGGEGLEGFAKVAGMSAEDFARSWNETPTDALRAFIEGLNDIEDSGGSALKTLQDLDINAARQTQTIQGLMQMIGGLDDNLAMSRDAWAGVSDEWGDAGDAAREAERKAEGFSGSLSRLQNMAQNVGAELGESLVPVLDDVTEFLGVLYDSFVELDDGTKRGIVAVGAFAAALGPLMLLGKGVGNFFGGISSGLETVWKFAKAASQVKSLSGALTIAEGAASGLAGALKGGLVTVGITAAVGGIALLVNSITKGIERQEDFRESTEGLNDVVSQTKALDEYAATIDGVGESSEFTALSIDELIDANARRVESMRETADEAENQIAQLNTAQGIINKYAGQTDLTTEAQGRLEWALKLVNDQFGLSITQADVAADSYVDQSGSVRDLTDDINALVDAKKEEARVGAITSNLTEAMEGQREAARTLADIEAQYDELVGRYMSEGMDEASARAKADATVYETTADGVRYYGSAMKDAQEQAESWDKSVNELSNELGVAAAATSDAADEYDRLSSSMDGVKYEHFSARLEAQGKSFSGLVEDLRSLGADTERFASLSDDELKRVVDAYDGTASSIIPVLDELGVGMDEAGRKAAEMATGIQDRLSSIAGGTIATRLEDLGYNLSDLSQKMADAGISSDMLRGDIVGDFDTILAMAGDDINKLIYLIQNYDATPIADKQGNINVSGEEVLLYANGQIYTWNGQYLKDQSGNIVVQGTPELHDANGEVYTWNSAGQLQDQHGSVLVDATTLYDTNEEIYEFDGLKLHKDGEVVVNQLELTDAYNNCVKLNGYDLHLDGEVNVDYSEVSNAIAAVETLLRKDGSSATVRLNTVNTTTNRVVTETVGPTASVMSAPASLASSVPIASRATRMAAARLTAPTLTAAVPRVTSGPVASLARSGMESVARALSDDPGSYARAVTEEVRDAVVATRTVVVRDGSGSYQGVVRAIERLGSDLPSIIAENAPEAMPRDFVRGVRKAVRMNA